MELGNKIVLKKNCGKNTYKMRNFFQRLVDQGVLEVFLVEFDHETLLQEDKNSKIVKITKGASLISCFELRNSFKNHFIIRDPGTETKYFLNFSSYGGIIDIEGDQTIYHCTTLKRIADNFETRDIKKNGPDDNPSVPQEFIVARLEVSYNDKDDISQSSGFFKTEDVEGETDPLFEKVRKFVLSQA